MERTLVIVKPDGVQRSLIGEVVKRHEQVGLKLVAMKMLQATPDLVQKHYLVNPEWISNVGKKSFSAYEAKGLKCPFATPEECGQAVLERLKTYFCACPVVAMIWEGNEAVGIVRKVAGATEPLTSPIGSIRGDFSFDSYGMADAGSRAIRNIVHASGNVDEANKEIELWFKPEEIMNYTLVQDKITLDVNLDGLTE